jgi:hypothetical protein
MAIWVFGMVFLTPLLHAQTAQSGSTATAISLTAADAASLKILSAEQLRALANALEATPPISFDALPFGGRSGVFYSLAHPEWPPLPIDIAKIPVWGLSSESGSDSGGYLLDDTDYPEIPDIETNGEAAASPMTTQ